MLTRFKFLIRFFIWVGLCVAIIHTTQAQAAYQAVVLDKTSKNPINDVNVFLVNSSYGVYTDEQGQFSIPVEIAKGADLIYSHVNYEVHTTSIPIDYADIDTILLKSTDYKLESVTIKSEKSNLKEGRLEIFRKDLFNLDNDEYFYKKVDFNNPEAILFQVENDKLNATSRHLLEFENKYLGYKINCLLQTYERSKFDLTFKGKAVFQSLDGSKKEKKKYLKNRNEIWQNSQQKFFQNVVSNQITFSNFTFLALDLKDIENGFAPIIDFDKLVVPTVIDDVYALKVPSGVIVKASEHISRITSSTGIILLNKNGTILNKDEVTINGYWSQKSLAQILPVDYNLVMNVPQNHLNKPRRAIADLKMEARVLMDGDGIIPIEAIHLETDRFFYNFNEPIFVSAYLYDHRNRLPFQEEIIVHFDLVDSKGKIISRKSKKSVNGSCSTGFYIDIKNGPGQYGVRAYTDYMKNFDKNTWAKTIVAINQVESKREQNSQAILTFSVEGGTLIVNSENVVSVKITDSLNNPIKYDGKLLDTSNDKIYTIKTLIDGLAIINLTPNGDSHFELIEDLTNPSSSNLDALKPESGAALSVQTRNTDHFKIKIKAFESDGPFTLGIYDKGREVYTLDIDDLSKIYSISKDFLPKEILSFHLRDTLLNIVGNRLIDNTAEAPNLINFQKTYQFFYTDQPAQINIIPNIESVNYIDTLSWNVKIVHKEFLKDWKVNNVLQKPISINNDKLSSLSHTNRSLIRNYQLIGNNISEAYEKAYTINAEKIIIPNTNATHLSGQLFNPEIAGGTTQGIVSITKVSDDDLFHEEIESDKDGRFSFRRIPFETNIVYILQARKEIPKDKDMYEGSRMVEIKLDSVIYDSEYSKTTFPFLKNLTSSKSLTSNSDSLGSDFSTDVLLDEVTIKERKSYSIGMGNTKDVEKMDFVPKNSSGTSLLSNLFPAKLVQRSINDPTNLQIRISSSRGSSFVNLVIIINGQQQFNTGLFYALTADQIKYASLSQNVLSIITTPNYVPRSERDKYKYGYKQVMIPQAIDFTNNQIINLAMDKFRDRKTSYWQPGFRVSNDSENAINFTTSNLPGTYTIRLSAIHPTLGYIRYSEDFEVREEE